MKENYIATDGQTNEQKDILLLYQIDVRTIITYTRRQQVVFFIIDLFSLSDENGILLHINIPVLPNKNMFNENLLLQI